MRMGPEDIKGMAGFFMDIRRASNPPLHAELLFYMVGLGLFEPDEFDRERLKEALKVERGHRKSREVATLHYYMHQLGFGEKITKDDVAIMKSPEPFYAHPSSADIAKRYHYMRELGVKFNIPPEDKERMFGSLITSREENHGHLLLPLHYYMRKLGYQTEIIEDDMKVMENAFEGERSGKKIFTPEMHYILYQMFPLQHGDASEMPPLKKL